MVFRISLFLVIALALVPRSLHVRAATAVGAGVPPPRLCNRATIIATVVLP